MRSAPPPTSPASTLSGTIRPAPGRRTTASASTTCCCRRKPPTALPTSASTAMCTPGKSRPTTCRYGSIWRSSRQPSYKLLAWPKAGREHAACLFAATLEPVFQIDQGQRPLVIVGVTEGVVVERLDPSVFGAGAIAAERQPHQAARRLPRRMLTLEQHVAQHGLGAAIALGRGELKPPRRL